MDILLLRLFEFNKKRFQILIDVRDEISEIILNDKKYDYLKNKYKSTIDIESILQLKII